MRRTTVLILIFMTSHVRMMAQKNQDSYLVVRNIKYATFPKADPKLNMLDIYMPKKGSNSPVLIWIHGGAFAYGDKEYVQEKAEFFTKKGYVFISINYRLSPKVVHPAHVQDVS